MTGLMKSTVAAAATRTRARLLGAAMLLAGCGDKAPPAGDSVATAADKPTVAADAGDWPMYNRDVRGWRHNSAERTINPSNAARIEEKWRFPAADSGEEIGV